MRMMRKKHSIIRHFSIVNLFELIEEQFRTEGLDQELVDALVSFDKELL